MIGVIFNMASTFPRFWPRQNGIYKITNRVTGRFYIGKSEGKKGFRKRWLSHRQELRRNVHGCSYLQNSYNKYGESCFTFEILEITEYGTPLTELESEYIFKLKSMNFQNGYNLRNDKFTLEYPEEHREKHHTAKEFEILDPDGNLIKAKNIAKFCEERGLVASSLCQVLKGNVKSCGGYKSPNPEFHQVKREYRLLSPKKELVIFNSIKEFAKEIGVGETSISSVLRGINSHAKGYHLENPSPEHQKVIDKVLNEKLLFNKDLGIIVRFLSIGKFSKKYNIPQYVVYQFFHRKGEAKPLTTTYNWTIPTEEDMKSYPIIDEGL